MITENDVKKIAKLARIRIRSEEELKKYSNDLSSIFNVIDELQELNVDGINETINIIQNNQPMRKDVVNEGGYADKVLKNAPHVEFECFFTVPKVIE